MVFDLDPFDDTLAEQIGGNARAGSKFQPKAKPRLKKATSISAPPSSSSSKKEDAVITASRHDDISQYAIPADCVGIGGDTALPSVDASNKMPSSSTQPDFLLHLETQEPVKSSRISRADVPMSVDDIRSAPVDVSLHPSSNNGYVTSTNNIPHLGDANTSDIHGDVMSGFDRSSVEAADFFPELGSFDDILSQPAMSNVNTVRKFQPKVKGNPQSNPQPRNKLTISRLVTADPGSSDAQTGTLSLHGSNFEGMEVDPSLPAHLSTDSALRPCSSVQPKTAQDSYLSHELLNHRGTSAPDSGDLWIGEESLDNEGVPFPDLESFDVSGQATATGNAQLFPSDSEYLDDDLNPAYAPDDFLEFSTMRYSGSVLSTEEPSELQVTRDLTRSDVCGARGTNPEEFTDSQAGCSISGVESIDREKRKLPTTMEDTTGNLYSADCEQIPEGPRSDGPVSATSKENETGISSMQPRETLTTGVAAYEMEDDTTDNGNGPPEPSKSVVDKDDNNNNDGGHRGGETSNHTRVKTPKKANVGKEKTIRKRRKSSQEPDSSKKEPPKKKLPHSTRRTRRRVDKSLLETPDEEINPRKLSIKELILLAEAKERMLPKGATTSNASFPNQSQHAFSSQRDPFDDTPYGQEDSFDAPFGQESPFDSPFGQDDPFGSSRGGQYTNASQPTPAGQQNSFKLNYHSYMNKTPKERWSKEDTELFYQGIRQFGTDFAMIQQLFPGRTRHQVKLKYKKEEREQRLRLHDALQNRSKDYSHFEMVIDKLKKAAAEAEDRDAESIDLSGEEEEGNEANEGENHEGEGAENFDGEEEVHNFNEDEQMNRAGQKKEEVAHDVEPMVNDGYDDPFKSNGNEEEDVYSRWNEYKSDYDVF